VTTLTELPENLPIPSDDGACNHLLGMMIPPIELPATNGKSVKLAEEKGYVVVYCYPMTGRPDQTLPENWDQIPGARGCTPQSCAFRDQYQAFVSLNAAVYGLSTQTTEYQKEAAERLHLPFPLLSDASLEFASALRLPTFDVDGLKLFKRLTLIVKSGQIVKVFYPVFPPTQNAEQVADWLRSKAV